VTVAESFRHINYI